MKRISTIIISLHLMTFSLEGSPTPRTSPTLFDVFPLTPKLFYAYDYYYQYSLDEVGFLVTMFIDSGLIQYIVRDSSVLNDSTIAWNIEERRIIWHKRFNLYARQDTSYWTNDTIAFSLFENTTGLHQLSASAGIWTFPLSFPEQPVYRYSNSQTVTIARLYTPPGPLGGSGRDSLFFSTTKGFYRRTTSYGGGANTHFFSGQKITLRGNPVVNVVEQPNSPITFELYQNHPNPFNPTTTIRYFLPKQVSVSLAIYDLLGRKLMLIDEGLRSAGSHSVELTSDRLSSGIYFYRLESRDFVITRKLIVAK